MDSVIFSFPEPMTTNDVERPSTVPRTYEQIESVQKIFQRSLEFCRQISSQQVSQESMDRRKSLEEKVNSRVQEMERSLAVIRLEVDKIKHCGNKSRLLIADMLDRVLQTYRDKWIVSIHQLVEEHLRYENAEHISRVCESKASSEGSTGSPPLADWIDQIFLSNEMIVQQTLEQLPGLSLDEQGPTTNVTLAAPLPQPVQQHQQQQPNNLQQRSSSPCNITYQPLSSVKSSRPSLPVRNPGQKRSSMMGKSFPLVSADVLRTFGKPDIKQPVKKVQQQIINLQQGLQDAAQKFEQSKRESSSKPLEMNQTISFRKKEPNFTLPLQLQPALLSSNKEQNFMLPASQFQRPMTSQESQRNSFSLQPQQTTSPTRSIENFTLPLLPLPTLSSPKTEQNFMLPASQFQRPMTSQESQRNSFSLQPQQTTSPTRSIENFTLPLLPLPTLSSPKTEQNFTQLSATQLQRPMAPQASHRNPFSLQPQQTILPSQSKAGSFNLPLQSTVLSPKTEQNLMFPAQSQTLLSSPKKELQNITLPVQFQQPMSPRKIQSNPLGFQPQQQTTLPVQSPQSTKSSFTLSLQSPQQLTTSSAAQSGQNFMPPLQSQPSMSPPTSLPAAQRTTSLPQSGQSFTLPSSQSQQPTTTTTTSGRRICTVTGKNRIWSLEIQDVVPSTQASSQQSEHSLTLPFQSQGTMSGGAVLIAGREISTPARQQEVAIPNFVLPTSHPVQRAQQQPALATAMDEDRDLIDQLDEMEYLQGFNQNLQQTEAPNLMLLVDLHKELLQADELPPSERMDFM